jgi:exonuclease SbcC
MRLIKLEVEGFRGLPSFESFDLDAEAVVIVGVNGAGKTSLLDAILWCLTGRLSRVEAAGGAVRSGFSPSGETRVAVDLRGGDRSLRVIRSQLPDEKAPRLTFEESGDARRGIAAEAALLATLWPAGLDAAESSETLEGALTRSVYLQQDLIRQFVEADSDRDRFDVLSELIGAGRVAELYLQLERGKKAWSAATNTIEKELQPLEARLRSLHRQLQSVSESDRTQVEEPATKWGSTLRDLGISAGFDARETVTGEHIDGALRQLDVALAADRRRLSRLEELLELPVPEVPEISEAALETRVADLSAEFILAGERLAAARALSADRARALEGERDRTRQLAELAGLALQHLGETCPVCTQKYNKQLTESHLRALLRSAPAGVVALEPEELPAVVEIQRAAADSLARARSELDEHRRVDARARALARERATALRELGLPDDLPQLELRDRLDAMNARLDQLRHAREEGENLALVVARHAQHLRRDEFVREADSLERRRDELVSEIEQRRATGDTGQQLMEAMRDAASDVVGLQLKQLEPLLAAIFSRIDPHPVLRNISFRSWTDRGRGRLRARMDDPGSAFSSDLPSTILSSSQLNALAVSIFLTLNLGVAHVPMSAALLDDPLQSLDNVNLLGLIDLLRQIRPERQLVVTTHDTHFGDLLERKLRPLEGQRTVRIDLTGWSRSGPVVHQRRIESGRTDLRLVA